MFDFKFDWEKNLNTSIESIDVQHKQLFKLGRDMEQLLQMQCIGVTDKQLLDIVCGLRDFTAYHFMRKRRSWMKCRIQRSRSINSFIRSVRIISCRSIFRS